MWQRSADNPLLTTFPITMDMPLF